MQNNVIYKQFEQVAIDGNFTIAQVQNATKTQIANLLRVSKNSLIDRFIQNMKNTLVARLRRRDDETDRQFLINQLEGSARTAFRIRFPDAEVEKKRDDGKRIIIIHLDGKP